MIANMEEKKSRKGRPVKLTEEIAQKLVRAIRAGNYIETACAYAGINPSTFYRWLEKGEKSSREDFRNFARQVREAMAEAEIVSVAKIKQTEDWRAQAWLLERRFADRWGKRETVELQKGEGIGKQIKWDDEVTELIAELTNKLAEKSKDSPELESEWIGDNSLEGKMETS